MSLSSVVNSNGRTITQRWVEYQGSATPNTNTSLVEFTEPTTATGTTTFTDSQTSANGAAFHFVEQPTSSTPSVTGNLAGTAALTASAGSLQVTSLAAGGVGTTSAKVRIDGTPGTSTTVTAATNTGLTTGAVTSSSVTLDSDGLGIATLTGLSAGTDYYVGATLSGSLQAPRATFRTAQSGAHSFAFASASCAATFADPTVIDSIRTRVGAAGRTAEFFAHMGDIHYRERATTNTSLILGDWREVVSRTRHGALFAAMPVEYTWSDHDLGPDNSSGTSLGISVMTAERTTYNRYFPTYDLPAVDTDAAPYRSWVRGRVRFTMTDGRTYMSAIGDTDNSSKTKLGATQKQWLKDEWTAAKAAGQAIVWLHEDGGWTSTSAFVGDDTWAAYTTERTELATFITSNGLTSRLLLIHGDFHAMAYDDGTNAPGGIGVVCASPLNQTYFMPSQAQWSGGKYPATDPSATMYQYGWFDVVDTGANSLTITFTGYSNDNTGATSSDTSRMSKAYTLATASPAVVGNLAATGTLSATAVQVATVTATLPATATLAATVASTATGNLATSAALSASSTPVSSVSGTLAATGAMSAQVVAVQAVPAALTASGAMTAAVLARVAVTGNLTGTGSLAGTASSLQPVIGSLAATGSLAAASQSSGGTTSVTGNLTATATLTAVASVSLTASITATGTLSATVTASQGAIGVLAATASLSATISARATTAGNLNGVGTLAAQVLAVAYAAGALTAQGSYSAAVQAVGANDGRPVQRPRATITTVRGATTVTTKRLTNTVPPVPTGA